MYILCYVCFAIINKIQKEEEGGRGMEKLWGLSKFSPSGKRTANSEQIYRITEGLEVTVVFTPPESYWFKAQMTQLTENPTQTDFNY